MGFEGGCLGEKGSCGGIENALGAGDDAILCWSICVVRARKDENWLPSNIFFSSYWKCFLLEKEEGTGKEVFELQDKVLSCSLALLSCRR
jgi:hypothetical protein